MQVTAIVPSYNEEKTIVEVVRTLVASTYITKVIVVDESTDNTPKLLEQFKELDNFRLIHTINRRGKTGAIKRAVKLIEKGIVFLCDADLVGFKTDHIQDIVTPLLTSDCKMSIGTRDQYGSIGIKIKKDWAVGGERAMYQNLLKEVLNKIPDSIEAGYSLELSLNKYCEFNNLNIAKVQLDGMHHIHNISKWGKKGFFEYLKQWISTISLRKKLNGKH